MLDLALASLVGARSVIRLGVLGLNGDADPRERHRHQKIPNRNQYGEHELRP